MEYLSVPLFIKKAKSISNLLFTGDGGDEIFRWLYLSIQEISSILRSKCRPLRTGQGAYRVMKGIGTDQNEMFAKELKFDWSSIYSLSHHILIIT